MERSKSRTRARVGVVGCGLVAQVMHLPYLGELADRFEVAALCDISAKALDFAGGLFPDARRLDRWEDLVAEPLDVVMVLIPGSHAPVAIAAAEAGKHVFVEKPMGLSGDECRMMIDAAERAGVLLMVGYMKRYDPAYEELERTVDRGSVRLARITTLESPLEPYVTHYRLALGGEVDPDLLTELRVDDERRVTAAIGSDDPVARKAYRSILLDSVIHDLNGVRGLLGEPTDLRFAHVWGEPTGVTATLSFGEAECVFLWVDLPGIAGYEQDWSFYGADERATLAFPSPFLRSMPTRLVRTGGDPGTPSAWRSEQTVSYEEAFKRELLELHACVTQGREPRTGGQDGLRDVLLAQAIVRSHLEGGPVSRPTEP